MSRPPWRPAARGLRARRRREIANVEKLVGRGVALVPLASGPQQQVKAGLAPSPGLIAAAELARAEWDAR